MGIVHPLYYQIIEHTIHNKRDAWVFKEGGKVLYNPHNRPPKLNNVEEQFDLTKNQIIIELFRINGGKFGYYLANMRDRKYYYCGKDWEDVRTKFLSLGIGREDPIR